MHITIQVNVAPYTNQDVDTAIHMAEAFLRRGDKVSIFLFSDSILAVNKNIKPMRIDRNLPVMMEELAAKGVEINICGLCAEYRGLLPGMNSNGTVFSGVPEMAALIYNSDRYINLMP